MENACEAKSLLKVVYPVKTLPVSVTGNVCPLGCSHCGGHYLRHMVPIEQLENKLAEKKPKSILLSGGCDKGGVVPIQERISEIRSLLQDYKVNCHPGMVDNAGAVAMSWVCQVFSYDFTLDDQAIKEAFHTDYTGKDYVATLKTLMETGVEVVPHILVGLNRGRITAEYEAVEYLAGLGIRKIIFIVFIPTKGTLWENLEPPEPHLVADLIRKVTTLDETLEIGLGCMRPGGSYRRKLDYLALKAGIKAIVNPHPLALKEVMLEDKRIIPVRKDECCAFR